MVDVSKFPISLLTKRMASRLCASMPTSETTDLGCLASQSWDLAHFRPCQLMSRFARHRRVYYIEPPAFDSRVPYLRVSHQKNGLRIITPHLDTGAPHMLRALLSELFDEQTIQSATFWYYTPNALDYTQHLKPALVIYDRTASSKGTCESFVQQETTLLEKADVVLSAEDATLDVDVDTEAPSRRPNPEEIWRRIAKRERIAARSSDFFFQHRPLRLHSATDVNKSTRSLR